MADEAKLRWRTNIGRCPPELRGSERRVFVWLAGHQRPLADPDGKLQTWPADPAKGIKTNWKREGPAAIEKWSIAE